MFVPKDNGMIYGPYYELVESERNEDKPGTVRQRYIKYLGKYPGGVPLGTRLLTVDRRSLTYRSSIGLAQIWADDDVAKEDLGRLRKALDDLTPKQKENIRMIELIGRPDADAGDRAYGRYFPDSRTIRIYGVGGAAKGGHSQWHLEATLMHEAGHNTYDRLQSGAKREIRHSLAPGLHAQRRALRALERATDRQDKAIRDAHRILGASGEDDLSSKEAQRAMREARKAIERREESEARFNDALATADIDRARMPHAATYAQWQRAVLDEGAMTHYAKEKGDMGQRALMNEENYAEANAIFTGYEERAILPHEPLRPERRMDPEEARRLFPRTLAAWDETRKLEGY